MVRPQAAPPPQLVITWSTRNASRLRDDLPSGTVTFLFTDVEGSTRLLHELGAEGYAEALAEHRRVIRESCARQSGVEVDTQGDAFFFAFPAAQGALAAAGQMTEALAEGPIQVRIGLHTGSPLLTDEGYVGDDVHFGARVAASGHGGQVLLSAKTVAAVEPSNNLLQGRSIVDLGEHRLKDIAEAVSIFNLGDGSFPPLKTISNTNLPRPASSFVGRDEELAEVLSRIAAGARLVTLTGPGGTGETRLALESASSLVSEYKAGVFWVGLASVRDSALVTETISHTLGAKDGLADHIAEREMLLLLDNLEQVIEAAPELSSLLQSCPNLTLLATSRELLRVQGEVEYPVPPLAEPEAVSLFCERSQLEPSEEIAELCARLDNLPLAVELAAARAKALSPAQILERLSQRLDLLKGGRDADPRQLTLRATIEWSYELLSPGEQRLFARLSVFAGGCTLEAAEEVAGADLDTLQSLVEKSLVRFTDERYWMLETIREYSEERLEAAGVANDFHGRHAAFMVKLASALEAAAGSSVEHRAFASEQDNFRAALAWAERTGNTDIHLDLIGRSWWFWWYRGHPAEGLRWVEPALARSNSLRSVQRIKLLTAAAMFSFLSGDLDQMTEHAEEGLGVARDLNDAGAMIWPLIFLGIGASERGNYDHATNVYEEASALARQSGDRKMVGIAFNNLGVVAQLRGDLAGAVALFEEALTIARELGTSDEIVLETVNYADSLLQIGRWEEASAAAKAAILAARDIENLTSLWGGPQLLGAIVGRYGDACRGARLLGAAEGVRVRSGQARQTRRGGVCCVHRRRALESARRRGVCAGAR